MLLAEKQAIFDKFYHLEDSTSELVCRANGLAVKSDYVKLPVVGYVRVGDVKKGIVSHRNRLARLAKVKPVVSQEERRRLREARELERDEKHQEKQLRRKAKEARLEAFKQLELSGADYKRKADDRMKAGGVKMVGAMIHFSSTLGKPIAFADGYGYFTTVDGITWEPIHGYYTKFIKHRAPAHRNSRGEAMIIIPSYVERDQKPRLGKSRASISGWSQEEFEAATRFINERRDSTNS